MVHCCEDACKTKVLIEVLFVVDFACMNHIVWCLVDVFHDGIIRLWIAMSFFKLLTPQSFSIVSSEISAVNSFPLSMTISVGHGQHTSQ